MTVPFEPMKFLVMVRWGSGPRYIVGGPLEFIKDAEKLAADTLDTYVKASNPKRRGAKPRTYVMQILEVIEHEHP